MQDCKGDPTDFRWNVTTSADSWEQEYGWPPDSMWAESIWPAGQPAFALFQVRLPVCNISHPCLLLGCWSQLLLSKMMLLQPLALPDVLPLICTAEAVPN